MISIKEFRRKAEELQAAVTTAREELASLDDSPEPIRRRVALANELPELEKCYEVAVRNLNGAEERVNNLKKQKEEAERAYIRIKESVEAETGALINEITPKVKALAQKAMAQAREAYDVRESIARELAEANGKEYYPAQDQPVAVRAVALKRISEAIIGAR